MRLAGRPYHKSAKRFLHPNPTVRKLQLALGLSPNEAHVLYIFYSHGPLTYLELSDITDLSIESLRSPISILRSKFGITTLPTRYGIPGKTYLLVEAALK